MKIRHRILLLLFIVIAAMPAMAQSTMTDDQVIEYIKQQNAAGVDQKQIATDLIRRGATRDQLMRIRNRYQSEMSSGGTTNKLTSETDQLRINNGEEADLMLLDSLATYSPIEKRIFGHDIFRSKNLSFAPQMNIATPSTYTLGPGDQVVVDIYGAAQSSTSLTISPDGFITIPKIGPIAVSGLTQSAAQQKVRNVMGKHYQDSQISLSVGQTRTITVNILGEVMLPGTYQLSAFATVFNALYLAGGVTETGTLREIKVSRNGRIISRVDVYDYIMNGKLAGNVMLKDNDVILVGPYENLVLVEGKVKRPMYYEMKKSESLQSLIQYSGGFTGDAFKKKVRVQRIDEEGLTVHNIDEWDYSSFLLDDADHVLVDSVITRYQNSVYVTGAVFRPGMYRINNQITSVKSLVAAAGGVIEQAFMNRAVLKRMNEDRTKKAMTINLRDILDDKLPDVALQNEDSLIIASREELYDAQVITIEGEVFLPGNYRYSFGETIEDLIIEAGGLRESAALVNVEVARRIINANDKENEDQIAKVFHFTLNPDLSDGEGNKFTLEPYDYVTIHRNPDYEIQKSVFVEGEVNYSGRYVLNNREVRLSEILRRAGGVKAKGYARGARLIRLMSDSEKERQAQMLDIAKNRSDSTAINMLKISNTYSIGINLEKAINDPGCNDDVVLQAGDRIIVPSYNNTIKVNGEVLYPNTVPYIEGKRLSYYINQAGGYSKDAKKNQTYIIYANGQVSKANKGKVEPGCEIVVPTKEKKEFNTAAVGQWVSIASVLATMAAVIINVLK